MSLTSKNNEKIGAVNRGTPCESGLCNFCRTDCQGRCETWLSSLLGRRTLVPRDYGNATIGTENTTHVGVSYNALRIRGRVFGGAGLDPEKARTGDAAYCDADLTTAVGSNAKYPCDYPFLIGALSRNPVVDKYWDSFAVGAALCGIPLVIGENVGGGDNKTEFNPDGSIRALPDLDRRIAVYRRYYNGKGALFVQLNANDAYNGVADYVARKYGDFVCVEIKWGQGAKPINGEGLIRDLDYARFMKSRSYCLRPDPEDPAVQEAFRAGRVKHFTRYTGLTYPALSTPEEVLAEVAAKAEQLRSNLLRSMSHDLRTPLTSIIGSSSTYLAQEEYMSPEEKRKLVRNIEEDAQWLLNMVENLLSVTRIQDEKGVASVVKADESLEEVISESVQRFRKRFPDVQVRVSIPDSVIIIPMDATLIEQVINNLLENALFHSGTNGPIDLVAAAEKSGLSVSIKDYGKGIAPELLDTIFDGGGTSENHTGDGHKGMGIGLSICKTIINAHGGEIQCSSSGWPSVL